ncbi:UDP-N-acetylglucosamine 4-epimerase [Aquicella siphonis]|uniref:UDP-N-acetylglucosamine 4-epimerase n=1 Tax=Aquicella siphonis TaxID=254247 RepID=A0A5E4PEX6_9COXI|nr:NAD-dependent epimerase/dehydratase family protein [Aquicella siphonis]VVC74886.1 UDP-N-acetylglucosamine 4-epimerase [Aquicella siphonis]
MNTGLPQHMPPQRVLVTGGAGFIGSHTVDLLLDQGHDVVVLDNLSSGKLENLALQHPNLEFIEGDVLEYPFVEELASDCDAIMHLAAIVSVPQSIENPILSFQVNTQGFLHVLQAASKAGHPVRVVLASSASVYGDASSLPCRDDVPLAEQPLSPYALQKIHAENYGDLYFRLFGVKTLALRYFNVYGPRQNPSSPYSGVISRFLDAYQHDQELTVYGDGEQTRDFIHVADVAKANCLALQTGHAGVLNIATGKPHSLLQVIKFLESVGGRTARLNFAPARTGDIKSSFAAIRLAETHLGFKPAMALREGLERMLG